MIPGTNPTYLGPCLLKPLQLDAQLGPDGTSLTVCVPPTRSDVLHACDVAEDVAIAYGYNNIERRVGVRRAVQVLQQGWHRADGCCIMRIVWRVGAMRVGMCRDTLVHGVGACEEQGSCSTWGLQRHVRAGSL